MGRDQYSRFLFSWILPITHIILLYFTHPCRVWSTDRWRNFGQFQIVCVSSSLVPWQSLHLYDRAQLSAKNCCKENCILSLGHRVKAGPRQRRPAGQMTIFCSFEFETLPNWETAPRIYYRHTVAQSHTRHCEKTVKFNANIMLILIICWPLDLGFRNPFAVNNLIFITFTQFRFC